MAYLANTPVPATPTLRCGLAAAPQLTVLFSFTASLVLQTGPGVTETTTTIPPLVVSALEATLRQQPVFVLSGVAPWTLRIAPDLTVSPPVYRVYMTYPFLWYGDVLPGGYEHPIVNKSYLAADLVTTSADLNAAWPSILGNMLTSMELFLGVMLLSATITLGIPFRCIVV